MKTRPPRAGRETAEDVDDHRRYLLDRLDELIEHLVEDTFLESTARVISRLDWDPKARELSAVLDEMGFSCRVSLSLPAAVGEGIGVQCSCFYAQALHGSCQHTWAILREVRNRLRYQDSDPVVRAVLSEPLAPAWTRTFRLLDDLLARRSSDRPPSLAAPRRRRLTWRVGFTMSGYLCVGAWEQKASKARGKWTPGRRMSLAEVRSSPELLVHEADRRAAAAIREESGYYSADWIIDAFTALRALAGHPNVFSWDEPKQRVTVEEVALGLAVAREDDGLTLDGTLGGRPLASFGPDQIARDVHHRGVIGFDGSASRMLVAAEAPAVVELVLEIALRSGGVPAQHREQLLQRLVRFEKLMPLSLPPEIADESRRGDPRPVQRLQPDDPDGDGAGLRGRFLVRPAAGGSIFRPADGPVRVLSLQDGRRVLVERRFEEEEAAARAQAARLGVERLLDERSWEWRVSGDDSALDVVQAAQQEAARGRLVVEWPEGESRRVASAITPAALRVRISNRRDWFGVEGSIEGDGWRLPLLAVLQALREGRRYLRVQDGTWAVITRELRERLSALDDVAHVRNQRLEVDVTAAPVLRDLAEDMAGFQASRRFYELLGRLEAAEDLAPDPPADLTAELRAYQLEGYRWLRRLAAWGVGGCLADDMGLGKTVQTLAVLLDRRRCGPALVVAPVSVGFNWVREAERFAPALHVTLYRDTDREAVLGTVGSGDVVVASYGLVLRDAGKLAEVKWGTLVLDEAQAVKNSRTKTAKAIRDLEAGWRLALTGTPVENHLGELWSLFRAISPGLFGSWERFSERFAAPIEKHFDAERRKALSRLLRPFVLRRAKADVLTELPERTEVLLYAELGPLERQLYEDARLKALAELSGFSSEGRRRGGGRDRRFQALAALTRLRQLACHPALVDADWAGGSAKSELLLETVEELLGGGHRALVFSQFTRHLDLVRRVLDERGVRYQYLDGQTPAARRTERIDAFQDGDGDLFLISLKAGGTGLNLTAADYVIHLDPWWNPAVEDQATDRAHRIGQTRPVTVYRLVSRDTIEEQILGLHADKRDLVAGVLAGTDKAAKLSTAELVDLIRSQGGG